MRWVLDIAYRGTNYAGWQIQDNAHTVQAELEQALTILLREPIRCTGAGRTDAGVHARQLMVHFDTERTDLPKQFFRSLNGILPEDVSINQVYVPDNPDFHTRFDALSRAYEYRILRRKTPFILDLAMEYRNDLDLEKMQEATALLMNYEDFGSFCKAHADNQTNLCKMFYARWQTEGELWRFEIKANRFLRGMVRAIVGSLLEVGVGRMTVQGFKEMIESGDRTQAGPNVDAKGLYLVEVAYEVGALEVYGGD